MNFINSHFPNCLHIWQAESALKSYLSDPCMEAVKTFHLICYLYYMVWGLCMPDTDLPVLPIPDSAAPNIRESDFAIDRCTVSCVHDPPPLISNNKSYGSLDAFHAGSLRYEFERQSALPNMAIVLK